MKKYVVSIILIVLTFMLGMSNVNAASENLELVDVQVQSKNASITVDDVTLSGNTITSNITFNKVNDYVAFELTIKNNDDEEYKVISAEDNNTNNNIAISYIYSNDYIKKGETTKVTVKLKYVNDITDKVKLELNNLNVKINFAKPDGTTSELSINPTTGTSIFRYIVLAIISLIGLILILVKNKKKVGTALLILAVVAVPFSAIANEKFAINLKFNNIDVISEVNANNYATLIDGPSFNEKLRYYRSEFRKATTAEYNLVKDELTEENIISTEDSPKVVYMWETDDESQLYYSDAMTIYMNEDSSNMFYSSQFDSIDLSKLDSSKVTTMESMFQSSESLVDLDITSFDTSRVTNMSHMFEYCSKIEELDLSSFNTSHVTDMSYMFNGNYNNLTTIYVFDEWDTSSVTKYDNMFSGNNNLIGEEATFYTWEIYEYNENYDELEYAHVDEGPSNPGYLTLKGHTKDFSLLIDGGEYTFHEKHSVIGSEAKYFRKATEAEYNSVKDELEDYNIISEYSSPIPAYMWADGDYTLYYSTASVIYTNKYAHSMFGASYYETIDISGMDGSRTVNMSGFFNDENLRELILGDFDTSNVTDMSYMFNGCDVLEEIDLSPFDISNVTNMSGMFGDCENLATIYVSATWDISNVDNTENMFSNTYKLVGEKATTYDENHTDGEYARIDGGSSNPGYLTLKGHTKNFAIIIPGDGFNEIIDPMNTYNKEFRKATTAEYNSVKDTLTNDNAISLGSPKVYIWETDESILYYSSAPIIYLNKNSANMFANKGLKTIDMSGFDTSYVTSMANMFSGNSNLMELDLSSFNTSSVTDTSEMFKYCENLATIYVSATWDISNVDNTSDMFYDVYNIVGEQGTTYDSNYYYSEYAHVDGGTDNPGYLTLKGHTKNFAILTGETLSSGDSYEDEFNNKIRSMDTYDKVFRKATVAEYNSVKDTLTDDNIASIVNSPIEIYMWGTNDSVLYYSNAPIIYLNRESPRLFTYTEFKKIDLSGFDTSLVTNMSYMFEGCNNLEEIDLSSFDISNATNMSGMFEDCENLATIYVSEAWDISNVEYTDSMFHNDYSILGGQGTTYNSDYTGESYAHIDGGPSNPGYLTLAGSTRNFAVTISGNDINNKLMTMNTYDMEFRKATTAEYNAVKDSLTNDNVISISSPKVYMWETTDSVLYYTDAQVVYLNGNLSSIFAETSFKTIDLSGFDTSKVKNMSNMFYMCSNLTTIYVSSTWDVSNVEYIDYMFYHAFNIVGGQGTTYDDNYANGDYAHIDEGSSNPGYLTDIADKE